MTRIAQTLGISRPHLAMSSSTPPRERDSYQKSGDPELVERIQALVKGRPTYGYRRVTAMLNRAPDEPGVNHKRVYRVMKQAALLLPKHTGRARLQHDGKVITMASNMRWCSDMFEVRCWDGDKVHVAFSLDCCDREAISWVAANRHLDGEDVRDLMAMSIETRFGDVRTPKPVEWLTDNGGPFISNLTRAFGGASGLIVVNTPAYSPESNGMAEAFVKTFKRDYVYLGDISTAAAVLAQLPAYFADYNDNHPHKGLKMLSPRQFRRIHATQ